MKSCRRREQEAEAPPCEQPSARRDSKCRDAVAAAQQRFRKGPSTGAKSGRTGALWHNELVGGQRPRSGGGQNFPIQVRTLNPELSAEHYQPPSRGES